MKHSDLPNGLPATGYVRLSDLVGTRRKVNAKPAHGGILPFSASTLLRGVKDGTFPAPLKLSKGVVAWRVEDVRTWLCARAGAKGGAI